MGTALTTPESLAPFIKVRIEKGKKSVQDAENHFIAAAQHLKEARPLVRLRADLTWTQYCKDQCDITRRYANRLILLADGKITLTEMREEKAAAGREVRAQAKAHRENGTHGSRSAAKSQSNQSPDENDAIRADITARLKVLSGEQLKKVNAYIIKLQAGE